jgi:hypothetical protein
MNIKEFLISLLVLPIDVIEAHGPKGILLIPSASILYLKKYLLSNV